MATLSVMLTIDGGHVTRLAQLRSICSTLDDLLAQVQRSTHELIGIESRPANDATPKRKLARQKHPLTKTAVVALPILSAYLQERLFFAHDSHDSSTQNRVNRKRKPAAQPRRASSLSVA
jgi:hypothetical protein